MAGALSFRRLGRLLPLGKSDPAPREPDDIAAGIAGMIALLAPPPPAPPPPAPDPIGAAARLAMATSVTALNLSVLPALFGLGLMRTHIERRRP